MNRTQGQCQLLRSSVALFSLGFLVVLAGCSGGGSSSPPAHTQSVVQPAANYVATTVTPPVGAADGPSEGLDLNNADQVMFGATRAGAAVPKTPGPQLVLNATIPPYNLWQNGTATLLTAGFTYGQMNNSGVIIANATGGGGAIYSVGEIIPIPAPSGFAQDRADAINDSGDIAGIATTSASAVQAFLWQVGTTTSLGLPAGITSATCVAINSSDEIIGTYTDSKNTVHNFLWNAGVLTDLGTFVPAAINTSGEIAGEFPPGVPAAWVSGQITLLPLPTSSQGSITGSPEAIDSSGDIVGVVEEGATEFAALWSNGVLFDLTNASKLSSGLTVSNPTAINDHGQILAWGTNTSGEISVVILVPEAINPATRGKANPPHASK